MKITSWNASSGTSELLSMFFARELKSIGLGIFWGAIAAAIIRALSFDRVFQSFLTSLWGPSLSHFSDRSIYFLDVCVAAVALLIFATLRYHTLLNRALRSWRLGVSSGLQTLSFAFCFAVLTLQHPPLHDRVIGGIIALCGAVFSSAWLNLRAARIKAHVPSEDDVRVAEQSRRLAGTALIESDDPIQIWAEDSLGRAALVDALSIRILVSRSPVIALYGAFGSGKTSLLNLLRGNLIGKAIVITFNTWLPGSQDALTSYLMSDISSQCEKEYAIPELRNNTRRFARALGKSVTMLNWLPELLPVPTQKDDIEALRASLERLPKRVVVLLDELDRMDKDEVRTLLKVVRGVSSLPNLSFVCAAEHKVLLQAMAGETEEERNRYFEKFFPVAIQVPAPEKCDLKRAGVQRILTGLRTRDWFTSKTEEEEFQERLQDVWEARISPFCTTLRAIGLLANDVAGAAALLRREVDPIDLLLVELLRRFEPTIYDLVSRSGLVLTGGEGVFRGGIYYPDDQRKQDLARFLETVSKAYPDQTRVNNIKAVLGELFPSFAKAENLRWFARPRKKDTEPSDNRIYDGDIFPAYFRYELPKAIFSTLELEQFIQKSREARNDEERREVFRGKLRSMDRGSLVRDDFLRKLGESVQRVDLRIAEAWVFAALTLAADLTYDLFAAFGESAHVMRMIIRVSKRLQQPERLTFLSDCILVSTDDTIPLRILTLLTDPRRSEDYCNTTFPELYPVFMKRMRSKYGPEVDALHMDLITSDPQAFALWGDQSRQDVIADPKDREIQRDFWLRRIDKSRAMLGETFNQFIMPEKYVYSEDPTGFIERKIPVEDLRRLFETLPEVEALNGPQGEGLRRLGEFLEGKYANGVAI